MFKKIESSSISKNVFNLFNQEYAILVSGDATKHNPMTISWGSLGVLWRKEIAVCYVRPNRYSFHLIEKNNYFSICWFDNNQHDHIMNFCGTKSGRDYDKDLECNLTPIILDHTVAYQEATMIITCHKLYSESFKKANFVDKTLLNLYKDEAYHHQYIGEIMNVYIPKDK